MIFVRPVNDNTPNVTNPFSGTHKGVDYGYNQGEPVYASESGQVVVSINYYKNNWKQTGALSTEDYGNYIKIKHDSHYATLYAHLRYGSLLAVVGQHVEKGQKIAEVGNTGNSSGPHLHWEIRYDNIVIDPTPLMDTSFTGYNFNSQPMNDRRPYWFDLMNKVIWNKPHEQITDKMVNDWIANYKTERARAYNWDLIVNAAYGVPTDSNSKSVDQVTEQIKSTQAGNSTILAQQLADCQAELKAEKDKYYKLLEDIKNLIAKY